MSNVYRFHLNDENTPAQDIIIGANTLKEALSYYLLEYPDAYLEASIIDFGLFYSFDLKTESYSLTYTIYEAKYKLGKIL